jgi:hypothetical protein
MGAGPDRPHLQIPVLTSENFGPGLKSRWFLIGISEGEY